MVEYHSICAKDQSRLHQLSKKVFLGTFVGFALYAGGIWKRDILVADVEALENLGASEMHARRLNAKKVLIPKKGEEFVFPSADGSVKLAGRDQVFRTSTSVQDHLHEDRSTTMFFKESRTGLNHQSNKRMTLKPEMISGVFLGIIFIVIAFNQGSNFTCQTNGHAQFHTMTLMLSG